MALLAFLFVTPALVHAQTGEWEWVGGRNTLPSDCDLEGDLADCGNPGIYGKRGAPAAENVPGGRNSAVTWTGLKGNLWLFGGIGIDSEGHSGGLNDLWQFSPVSREWNWIAGSNKVNQKAVYGEQGKPAPANTPEANAGYGWSDPEGNLWLDVPSELWEFNTTTDEWTWWGNPMQCSDKDRNAAKYPGDRTPAATWGDSEGNFWIFGGWGSDEVGGQGYLNDLWKFNLRSRAWTFMGGDLSFTYLAYLGPHYNPNNGSYGNCGVNGEFSAQYMPGSRTGSYSWIDANGNLWLFGGTGFDCGGCDGDDTFGDLSDLWEFDVARNEWAFMAGSCYSQSNYDPGNIPIIYGTQGVLTIGAAPGPRSSGLSWTGKKGVLWLLGGTGYSTDSYGILNDMWEVNTPTLQWVWMRGTNSVNAILKVDWGRLGQPAAANYPGPRGGAATWTDREGNLWLFGGEGGDLTGNSRYGSYNDLWRYAPKTVMWPTALPSFDQPPGDYLPPLHVALSDFMPAAKIYYTTDGSAPSSRSTRYIAPIDVNTSMTIDAVAVAPGMNPSEVVKETYIILKTQTIDWPPITQSYPVGSTLVLSATASSGLPVTYQLYTGDYPPECALTAATNTVTFLNPGTCTIYASQSGNNVYAGVDATQQITVTAH